MIILIYIKGARISSLKGMNTCYIEGYQDIFCMHRHDVDPDKNAWFKFRFRLFLAILLLNFTKY